MKSDADVKRDVEAELKWCPDVDETDIAVKVTGGVVTLTGYVKTYPEKFRAETAVRRVAGVSALANDIAVRLSMGEAHTDPEIARDVLAELKRELPFNWQQIQPVVHQGTVSLQGYVEWHYQRDLAERAVRGVKGVLSVRNSIKLEPKAGPVEVERRIAEAFRRSAELDASHIVVEAQGGKVTLKGAVRTWSARNEAEVSAWSAPGVLQVSNELAVRP